MHARIYGFPYILNHFLSNRINSYIDPLKIPIECILVLYTVIVIENAVQEACSKKMN